MHLLPWTQMLLLLLLVRLAHLGLCEGRSGDEERTHLAAAKEERVPDHLRDARPALGRWAESACNVVQIERSCRPVHS